MGGGEGKKSEWRAPTRTAIWGACSWCTIRTHPLIFANTVTVPGFRRGKPKGKNHRITEMINVIIAHMV